MIRGLVLLLWSMAVLAADAPDVKTTWRLLDYVAVDYRGAVADGAVKSTEEYAEMTDFAATIHRNIDALPAGAEHDALLAGAAQLQTAIADRVDANQVATLARDLAGQLLAVYPVALSPKQPPNLARGQQLYAEQCAGCHGADGHGDGPLARQLEPKPVAFSDVTRARERSLFALYQVVTQGLDGTAMPSFAQLPDTDRWALAFTVGQFAYPQAEAGEALWKDDAALHSVLPDMDALTTLTPAALAGKVGSENADALTAYLRRHPEALVLSDSGVLRLAHDRLAASLDAYHKGDTANASRLAVSAYLDGFEPVEPQLAARDADLLRQIEGEMTALRSKIGTGASADEVGRQIETLQDLLRLAEDRLSTQAGAASSFAGAFTILLREGLEALLIVVAMIAFLRKAQRTEVLPYVHAGTAVALAGGVATWGVATYLVAISGASRELTEGAASLFAAAVLLFVGIWMHGKSQAGAWQQYIREKVSVALSRRSGWFLFVLAFVVVYREVFETILFYVALWTQGNHQAVLAGAAAATVTLAVITWLLLRASTRLPIGLFFSVSAILMAVLAVVLTGKGIAALQEANVLPSQVLALPRFDLVGFYPTMQGLGAQFACLGILIAGFLYNQRAASAARK
jgi:high-affinity iron transporter